LRTLCLAAILALTALTASTAPVIAQVASYTYIPQKAPGRDPSPPWLTALTPPRLGTAFQVQAPLSFWCMLGGGRNEFWLFTGLGNPNFVFHNSAGFPYPGGWLYSTGEVVTPLPYAASGGITTISIPIPLVPSLIGANFYQQVVLTGVTLCPGHTFSRGGHGVIGR
jgi:hypothetical protein